MVQLWKTATQKYEIWQLNQSKERWLQGEMILRSDGDRHLNISPVSIHRKPKDTPLFFFQPRSFRCAPLSIGAAKYTGATKWNCFGGRLESYILRGGNHGDVTFVINTVQVFNKTITAKSISNFTLCQQSITDPKMEHSNKGTCKSINEPFSCWETQMLGETQARGIVKKGHATTLHSLIRINTKFGDGISAVLQDSVNDGGD